MKITKIQSVALAGLAATVALVQSAKATLIEKADNSTALNVAGAWTNNVVPGTADIAQWDSTVTAANTTNTLGAALSWGGIRIVNPAAPVLINAGSTLTIGAAGIDMSAATVGLTLSNSLTLLGNESQSWNVPSGQTLSVAGAFTRSAGSVLTFNNAGTINIGSGTASSILYYSLYNGTDVGALNASDNVSAFSSVFTYTPNVLGGLPTGYCDVVNANTGTADDVYLGTGAYNMSLIRFNIPQPNRNYWSWNCYRGDTSLNSGPVLILVTTNVGACDVFFKATGSGGIGLGWRTSTGSELIVDQENTAGSIYFSGGLSQKNALAANMLTKRGAGRAVFNTALVHTGPTQIVGGELMLNSTTVPTSVAMIDSGATLSGIGNISGPVTNSSGGTIWPGTNGLGSLTLSNLTLSAGSGLKFYAPAQLMTNTTALLNVTGGWSVGGAVSVSIAAGRGALGQFPLIKLTNAFDAGTFANFTLAALPARMSGYLSNNVANASLDLVITNVAEPIVWTQGSGTWDVNTSINWQDTFGNPTTYQENNGVGDSVLFQDTSSGASPITVTINTNLFPASTTFSNSTKIYTLSGSGSVSGGGSLTKSGSGTLTLATANSFSGGININGGLVSFSALTNLGSGAINFGGGTLQYNGNSDDISVRTVSFNPGGGTIDTAGQTVNYANPIGTGAGGGLTKTGTGTLTLNGTNKIAGVTVVNQGTLALGANSYLSNSVAIIINGGATLDANSSGVNLTLATANSQILGGVGTVAGNVTAPVGTVITPATNGVYGTLNFANNLTISGATLMMDVANGSSDLISVGGDLSINSGSLLVITNATPLANGTYKLIQYSGSLSSGAGSSGNLTIIFSQAGKSAVLSDATAGEIDLIISSIGDDTITWSGAGSSWDLAGSQNWFIGGSTPWAFTNGDNVTFNDSATGNSTVSLNDVVQPGSMIVSNTAITPYTFADGTGTGGGKIGGSTSLVKDGTGTAILQTANTYSGATTIKNGTLQVGNGGAGDIGTGNVTNNGALVFGQSDGGTHTVAGAISGTGSVTQQGTATVVLTQNNTYSGATTISSGTLQAGTGGATGDLSTGPITNNGTLILNRSGTVVLPNNISGTGGLTKQGSSTLTFAGSLNYQGNTSIGNGLTRLTANEQIPDANTVAGSTGWLILDGGAAAAGTFDLAGFNETVNALSGLGSTFNGVITNSGVSTTTTNTLTVLGSASTTYNGIIAGNTNGSKVQLVLLGANTLRMNGVNTYAGGTIVGGTATIGFGPGASLGAGGIIMSNGTTYYMYNNGSTASFPNDNIAIVDGANVSMNSGQAGNGFEGTVSGDSNTTNSIIGLVSAGVANVEQWTNFFGTVLIPSGGSIRFSSTSLTLNGSDNATFDLEGTGGLTTRNVGTVHLGALQGNGTIFNPGNGGPGTYIIGLKGISTVFTGGIQGTNALVKSGAGTLTLNNGGIATTNVVQDGLFITTNVSFGTNTITYIGNTTISNGVLALVAQATLTNSPVITLSAPTAVLDASQMAYLDDTGTNLVTNSIFEVISGQTLNGQGSIYGFLQADAGSTLNPGNTAGNIASGTGTGVLTVSSNVTLNGAINLRLNNTNSIISDELAAPGYTISGATLVITNVGPVLAGGNVFHLFSSGINTNGFTSIVLPAVVSPLILSNNLAFNGTLVIVSPVNPNPTNITYSVSNNGSANVLSLSWPADHTGWYLQMQTNSLSTGLSTNWVDVPGSSAINSTNIVVDPTKPTVFYRLSLQP